MELIDYVRLLGRRWTWVVWFTVASLAVALAWTLLAPKQYRANAELFVGSVVIGRSENSAAAAQSASKFVLDRMESYAGLVYSPEVGQGVIEELDLNIGTQALSRKISAAVPSGTVLLRVSAIDPDPVRAADIANVTAGRLATKIEILEKPIDASQPLVDLSLARPATPPGAPFSPNRRLVLGLGLIAGLGAGLVAAALRDEAVRRRNEVAAAIAGRHGLSIPEADELLAPTEPRHSRSAVARGGFEAGPEPPSPPRGPDPTHGRRPGGDSLFERREGPGNGTEPEVRGEPVRASGQAAARAVRVPASVAPATEGRPGESARSGGRGESPVDRHRDGVRPQGGTAPVPPLGPPRPEPRDLGDPFGRR